jgi:hypothetical protein
MASTKHGTLIIGADGGLRLTVIRIPSSSDRHTGHIAGFALGCSTMLAIRVAGCLYRDTRYCAAAWHSSADTTLIVLCSVRGK